LVSKADGWLESEPNSREGGGLIMPKRHRKVEKGREGAKRSEPIERECRDTAKPDSGSVRKKKKGFRPPRIDAKRRCSTSSGREMGSSGKGKTES